MYDVIVVGGGVIGLSVAYYLQGLVPHAMPSDSAASLIQAAFRESPTLLESLITLSAIIALSLWLAGRAVGSKEYVLEQ